MKRWSLFAFVMILAAGCLLPATRQLGDVAGPVSGFIVTGETAMLDANGLGRRMPGMAPLYVEYGVDSVLVADYVRDGERYRAEVYQFADTNGAMGAYLAAGMSGNRNLDIGYRGRREDGAVQFVKGYYYLSVTPSSGGTADGAAALATVLASRIQGGVITPDLFETLPQEGLQEGSGFYFKGPRAFVLRHGSELAGVLHIADAVDGVSVTYLIGGHPVELYRITYPNREATLSALDSYASSRRDRPIIRNDLTLTYLTVVNPGQTEDFAAEMGERLYLMTGARQSGEGQDRFEYLLRGGK